MKHFGVIGNPISHSLSPDLFAHFSRAENIPLIYEKILLHIPSDFESPHVGVRSLSQSLSQMHKTMHGLNVTAPFKEIAFHCMDQVSEYARRSRAVNVITFKDNGEMHGDNTDGRGFVSDLKNVKKIQLAGKRVLILGAGGAIKNILPSVLSERPKKIIVVNRTEQNGTQLQVQFPQIILAKINDLAGASFDLIINGVSAATNEYFDILKQFNLKKAIAYDLNYSIASDTAFVKAAKKCEPLNVFDGKGMLIEQAALTFLIWFSVYPSTSALHNQKK